MLDILLLNIGILIFHMHLNTSLATPKCSNIITKGNADKGKSLGEFHGVYFHIPLSACYVCTQPECDDKVDPCESSLPTIPVYNNIFEFGVSGKYFPSKINANILINQNCYFKVEAFLLLKDDAVNVTISECSKQSDTCSSEPFQAFEYFRPNSWYCLYFAVAFYESNKMHFSLSYRCDIFATVKFNPSTFMSIKLSECEFKPETIKAEAQVKFQQDKSRTVNGVPVILPCSPGGHGADAYTGHFVVGDICHSIFGKEGPKESGIEFIIKNLFGNSEDWIFPRRETTDIIPIYLIKNKARKREEMMAKKKENTVKALARRNYCDYIYPRATTRRTTTTGFYRGKRYKECEDILTPENLQKPNTIATFLRSSSCLVCTDPTCDFSDEKCQLVSALETLYVYNNLFEFGIPLFYFPRKVLLRFNINNNCYYKLILEDATRNYTILLEECLVSTGNCVLRRNVFFDLVRRFQFCASFAIAFAEKDRIYHGFSSKCDVVPSTELDKTIYILVENEECYYNITGERISVEIEVLQDDRRSHNGIPIILPCSPGGYIVDTKTGRFISGEDCQKMAYRSDSPNQGIQLILDKIYQNDEDLLFPSQIHSDKSYPYPIYYRLNRGFYSPQRMEPRRVKNEEAKNRERIGCETTQVEGPKINWNLSATTVQDITETDSNIENSGGSMDSSESTKPRSQYSFVAVLTILIIIKNLKLI